MPHYHGFFKTIVEKKQLGDLIDTERKVPRRIGIDGNYLLQEAREWLKVYDPHWFLTSVIPPTLPDFLQQFLEPYEKAGMKAAIVFDGLPTSMQPPEMAEPPHVVTNVWCTIAHDTFDEQAPEIKQKLSELVQHEKFDSEVTPWIIRWLHQHKAGTCEAHTAPYLAWAQLAVWMSPQARYISDVVSYPILAGFMFIDRVILNIDVESAEVTILNRSSIHDAVAKKIGSDNVVDDDVTPTRAVIMLSRQPQLTFWRIQHWPSSGSLGDVPLTVDTWRSSESFTTVVAEVFSHCPVMTHDGECKPLIKFRGGMTTNNLRGIFYNNLQSEVPLYYFCLFSNVISPEALSVLATAKIVDQGPLVDTNEYRAVLERIIPLRTQIVFQLIVDAPSTAYFKTHFNLQWYRTFLTNANPTPILRPPEIKLDEWDGVSDEVHNFRTVLQYEARATQSTIYKHFKQSVGAVLLKSLDLLGYFTHAAHSNNQEVSSASIYANALSKCLEHHSHPEAGVLLIELVRTKTLNDEHLTPAHRSCGDFSLHSTPCEDGVRMACRILALVQIGVKGQWSAAIDAELNAYTSVVRAFQSSLRNLTEVVACMLWVNGTTQFDLFEFKPLCDSLPFAEPINCYASIITFYCLTNDEYIKAPDAPTKLALLKKTFACCPDIETDVKKMASFWRCASEVIQLLYTEEDPTDPKSRHFHDLASRADQLVTQAIGCFDIPESERQVQAQMQHN